jgi:hypothetical protein
MKGFNFLFILIIISTTLFATTDKYRCTLRDNPSTSIVIGWNQVSGATPVVYYDVIDHLGNSLAYSNSKTVDRSIIAKGMNNQFARLTGLAANTIYYFIIQDDNSTSQRFSFKTAPDVATERLSFIAGGDSRNNRLPRQNANTLVAKTRPNAVLFGGDMTNADSDLEWQNWFDDWQLTTAADGRMTAIVATRGNHEWNNASIYDLFDTPNADIYYAHTFGGNLFRAYTLNTMIAANGAQKTWLENDLITSSDITWKSAQYHHPMRPHVSYKSENLHLVANWAPLFEQHGLDFAIECDAHTVKTTYPIHTSTAPGSQEGFIRDDVNGVVYVGEGCWGAPLRLNDDNKAWTRHSGSFNQVKWFFVDQNKIEIRTIKSDNASTIGALTDNNRFSLPSNINIWTPAPYEDVLIISKPHSPKELVLTNPLDRQLYMSLQAIDIKVAITNNNLMVSAVEFKVDEILIGIDSTAPFVLNWTPGFPGNYTIRATGLGSNGQLTHSNIAHIDVATGIGTTSILSLLNNSSDDAEESNTGIMYLYDSELQLGADPTSQKVGLKFNDIDVPRGATITNAYIQFTSAQNSIDHSSLTIKIQDNPLAAIFANGIDNISSRLTHSNQLTWVVPTWVSGNTGIKQQSPNLSNLVESITTKNNWTSGNSLAFIIEGTGTRTAVAADALGNDVPKLYITYTLNPPPISKPYIPDMTFCLGSNVLLIENSNFYSYFWQNNISLGQQDFHTINTGGSYLLRVMDRFGQVSSDTALITAHTSPNPNLGMDQSLNGGTITLSSAVTYHIYYWSTGEITSNISIATPGMYTLLVIDSNGCPGTDSINIFDNVSIQKTSNLDNKLSYYPNPANNFLRVKIDILPHLYPIRIELWNYSGQEQFSAVINKDYLDIDIQDFTTGFYYLRIIDGEGNQISKPLVVHRE